MDDSGKFTVVGALQVTASLEVASGGVLDDQGIVTVASGGSLTDQGTVTVASGGTSGRLWCCRQCRHRGRRCHSGR